MTIQRLAKFVRTVTFATVMLMAAAANTALADGQGTPPHESIGRNPLPTSEHAIPLERSHVCFVNDTYMGQPQIPVPVDGKTYYGCCRGCADRLHAEPSTRFATDPHTGKRVDKATAFITFERARSPKVLYFESAESYEAYRSRAP